MLKEVLKQIILSQQAWLIPEEKEIQREQFDRFLTLPPFAYILTGVRRSGKSTLLKQIMRQHACLNYFNFEDSRAVGFELSDFMTLEELFLEINGNNSILFFDEIQNVKEWERFVREAVDRNKCLVITGSNANMLSRELGTKLTGRHLDFTVFPFSYSEYLTYLDLTPSAQTFESFLAQGGFPGYLNFGKGEMLSTLVSDILFRDIFMRYNLRNQEVYKRIVQFLLSNVGKEISSNNLKNTFEIASTTSVLEFLTYLVDAYLLFLVPKYDTSLKVQVRNPKKIYGIDQGLVNFSSVSGSPDYGRLFENTIFLHLKRTGKEIWYFKGKKECDFIYRDSSKNITAIQVCWQVDQLNLKRELDGIIEAMTELKLNYGTIITFNQEDKIVQENFTVNLIPAWKWLMLKE